MTIDPAFLKTTLPPLRPGVPADTELEARRAGIAELSGPAPEVTYAEHGGLRCAVAAAADPRATIVHCHGGGYRHGTARGWFAFAQRLAAATGCTVILPDYSLAPEAPFPAAIHEVLQVLGEVLDAANGPLVLSGDSAGGGLALAAATIMAQPERLGGIVLLSPWLDLRLTSETYQRCAASDPVFSQEAATISAAAYLQGAAPDHPLASPLLADLHGLPPVQIHVGAGEVLLGDSLALLDRLADAGVRGELFLEPGAPHVWPVGLPDLPASHRVLTQIARFVDELSD